MGEIKFKEYGGTCNNCGTDSDKAWCSICDTPEQVRKAAVAQVGELLSDISKIRRTYFAPQFVSNIQKKLERTKLDLQYAKERIQQLENENALLEADNARMRST